MVKGTPLFHRHLRELKGDIGKYLVVFLLLLLTIGEVSGFLVADESMIAAYEESFARYRIEDGNFTVERRLNRGQLSRIQALGVTLYELFHTERTLENGAQLRLFKNRTEVNLACVMQGRLPEAPGEIAVDRLFAVNNHLAPGDTLQTAEQDTWLVTGLVALSDYSSLFSDNSDIMFDSVRFGVAVLSEEEFDALNKNTLKLRYAFTYNEAPENETEESEMSDAFLKELAREVRLTEYLPRYQNQAIRYAGDDLGADKDMIQLFLYIVMVIISFVFAVTISNTVMREANIIGTLRASGYTRGELVRHYLFLPVAVTLAAALFGNILGYTVLKDLNVAMYYNSYSMPTYETRWSAQAFLETTVVPIVIMLVIDTVILSARLALPVLQLLRRELKKKGRTGTLPLPARLPFFSRFRMRVILQNISSFGLLFLGISFANILLMFGLLIPSILKHYEEELPHNMLADYQYILQLPAGAVDEDEKVNAMLTLMMYERAVETDNPDAEKFSAYSLKTIAEGGIKSEEILLYGIGEESRYVPIAFPQADSVFVSAPYAAKYHIAPGDTITLKEPYADDSFRFRVDGIHDYEGALCVFMRQAYLNEVFDLGRSTFTGHLSATPITDIDESYIGSFIDLEALTKVSRQMDRSIGGFMKIVDVFSVVMFMVLIYLLSKLIIEKNAHAISMAKILGYTNREISALYLQPTTVSVMLFILLSLPISTRAIYVLYRFFVVSKMTGWIPFFVGRQVYLVMLALGLVTYAVVAVLEYRKIKGVPMEEALKNVE